MNNLINEKDSNTILEMAQEVKNVISANENVINRLVEKVLLELDLTDDVELRRDHDGVSQASYMVRKMIGEYLAQGKSNL